MSNIFWNGDDDDDDDDDASAAKTAWKLPAEAMKSKEDHIVFDWRTMAMMTMFDKKMSPAQREESRRDADFINATRTMKAFCILPLAERAPVTPLWFIRFMTDKGLKSVLQARKYVCSNGEAFRTLVMLCRRLDTSTALVGKVLFQELHHSTATAPPPAADLAIIKTDATNVDELARPQMLVNFYWDATAVSIDDESTTAIY